TSEPPKQVQSIAVREEPGWVTFSLDGKLGYPSTGEVIDTATKKILTVLADEMGRPVMSEKMVEIQWRGGGGGGGGGGVGWGGGGGESWQLRVAYCQSRARSRTGAEWVRAPMLMRSMPDSAIARMF